MFQKSTLQKGTSIQTRETNILQAQENRRILTCHSNDSFGKTGRRIAFTQGQTYTTLERIRKAKVTSELRF